MKKFVCLFTALLFCLSSVACAESIPSRTTSNLTKFEVMAESLPADTAFFIRPVVENEAGYQQHVEICQNEISALMQAESITDFFGEVKNSSGESVDIAALLESETLNVYEFCPFIAGEYEESYGKVTAKMLFSTPYEKDEKVIILIGIVTVNQDGTQSIEWVAYEGIGVELEDANVEEQGCLQVELDPEIVLAVQEGIALLAVVSK